VLGVLSAAWIFIEPYRPARLIHALPQTTVFFTTHERLGDRWKSLATHPVVAAVAEATGESPERFQRKLQDKNLDGWIRRLTGEKTHFAWSPAYGDQGQPAWVGSSWVGGKAAFFRLWLNWVGIKGYTFVGRHHGRSVWEIDTKAGPGEPRLRISLVDGMLVAVSSVDPAAIEEALDGLDGLRFSLATDLTGRRAQLAEWAAGAPDYGYYFLPNMPEYGPAFFRLRQMDAGGLKADARVLWPYGGGSEWLDRTAVLARLLGDHPQLLLSLPQRTFAQTILLDQGVAVLDEFAGMVLTNQTPFATLALLEGEYGGSHQGVKVPMALSAIPFDDEGSALTAANGFVASVNERTPFAWAAEPAGINDTQRLFALQGTVKSKYSKWTGDERAGFAVWENWLLLSTHVGSLRSLIARSGTPEAAFEASRAGWRSEANPATRGVLYVRAERLARTAAAWAQAYSLRLQLKDPEKLRAWAPGLEGVRRWSGVLETLGLLRATFREDKPYLDVSLDAGS
jgi:hypothetical protein